MSDDTEVLVKWLQGGVSESSAGRMYKRALDTIERLERDRDALAGRCEKLREALREFAIEPLYGGDLCAIVGQQCVVCGARTIYGSMEEPSHAPGCLAAPKDASPHD